MNIHKLILAAAFAGAAVAAQAQIALTGSGSFILGGTFTGLSSVPQYTPGSSVSTLSIAPAVSGNGSINEWGFSVVDTVPITTVTYSITLSGITSSTDIFGLIQGFNYTPASGTVGSTLYINTAIATNIDSYTGSTASTQTINFTEDITSVKSTTAFFEGDFQVTNAVPEPSTFAVAGLGLVGLFIRRRRN
jgi:hypothetical protein